jgi:hypothetical protein
MVDNPKLLLKATQSRINLLTEIFYPNYFELILQNSKMTPISQNTIEYIWENLFLSEQAIKKGFTLIRTKEKIYLKIR